MGRLDVAALVRLARPHQYTKNVLVFAAPGAAGRLTESSILTSTLLVFTAFCLVSSIGYVINDIVDVERDRRHPRKRRRPLASGAVTLAQAKVLVALLVAIAGVLLVGLGWGLTIVAIVYLAQSLLYSAGLKRLPWGELVVVSSGFVLRSIAGGVANGIAISGWFLIVVSAASLLLIVGKRLGELTLVGACGESRPVLTHYSSPVLRSGAAFAALLAVAAYVGWAMRSAQMDDQRLLAGLSIGPFAVAIGRYLSLSWMGRAEQPELLVVRDRIVVGSAAVWLALFITGHYR